MSQLRKSSSVVSEIYHDFGEPLKRDASYVAPRSCAVARRQPSILGRQRRINCWPQVLIAAITAAAIRGAVIARTVAHV